MGVDPISIGLMAVGAGASWYQGKRAKDEAKRQSRHAAAEVAAMDAQRRERESLSVMDRQRQQARERQRALMSGAFGRQSTLQTGGLGGEPVTAGKTLLGA